LSIGQEDDHEHHTEAEHILGTTRQSRRQLSHCLVERDVFEDLDEWSTSSRVTRPIYLDPSEKHGKGHDIVELNLPIGEKFEIGKTILILQQLVENLADFELTVDIEGNANVRDQNDHHIQDIPDRFEVMKAIVSDLSQRLSTTYEREHVFTSRISSTV
jgi:hypothetical protein